MVAIRSSKVVKPVARVTPSFAAHKVDDEATQRALADVRKVVQPAVSCPLTAGRQVAGVSLPSGAVVVVPHGLGRVPQGAFITKSSIHSIPIWQSADENAITYLAQTTDSVVDLWVY